VRISGDGAKAWESHFVLTEELAEVCVWVGILASLRSVAAVGFVENVDLVEIFWTPFNGVDVIVPEDTGSFPHSSDKGGAHHGFSIVILTGVFPAVLLSNSHDVGDVKASLCSFGCDTRDIQALCTKMLVESLGKEDVGKIVVNSLNNGESNWSDIFWEESRKVELWSVDPAVEEVVVTVWETLVFKELLLSSCFVEFGSHFIAQGHESDVETGIFGHSNPLREPISLDPLDRPVPSILALNNVKLPIKS
jgi:hypothetical protein